MPGQDYETRLYGIMPRMLGTSAPSPTRSQAAQGRGPGSQRRAFGGPWEDIRGAEGARAGGANLPQVGERPGHARDDPGGRPRGAGGGAEAQDNHVAQRGR